MLMDGLEIVKQVLSEELRRILRRLPVNRNSFCWSGVGMPSTTTTRSAELLVQLGLVERGGDCIYKGGTTYAYARTAKGHTVACALEENNDG